jgi:hypothetical protein
MQRYTVYLYLETVLHVSGGTSTYHQARIQLYLQHLVFVTPLLLSVAYRGRVGTGLSVLWVVIKKTAKLHWKNLTEYISHCVVKIQSADL